MKDGIARYRQNDAYVKTSKKFLEENPLLAAIHNNRDKKTILLLNCHIGKFIQESSLKDEELTASVVDEIERLGQVFEQKAAEAKEVKPQGTEITGAELIQAQ